MKKLNVALIYSVCGNSSIMVPDDMTLEEAIEYAKEHIAEIPTPYDAEYICDSDIIDEENCNFAKD